MRRQRQTGKLPAHSAVRSHMTLSTVVATSRISRGSRVIQAREVSTSAASHNAAQAAAVNAITHGAGLNRVGMRPPFQDQRRPT